MGRRCTTPGQQQTFRRPLTTAGRLNIRRADLTKEDASSSIGLGDRFRPCRPGGGSASACDRLLFARPAPRRIFSRTARTGGSIRAAARARTVARRDRARAGTVNPVRRRRLASRSHHPRSRDRAQAASQSAERVRIIFAPAQRQLRGRQHLRFRWRARPLARQVRMCATRRARSRGTCAPRA
jgi:hypothetical protein